MLFRSVPPLHASNSGIAPCTCKQQRTAREAGAGYLQRRRFPLGAKMPFECLSIITAGVLSLRCSPPNYRAHLQGCDKLALSLGMTYQCLTLVPHLINEMRASHRRCAIVPRTRLLSKGGSLADRAYAEPDEVLERSDGRIDSPTNLPDVSLIARRRKRRFDDNLPTRIREVSP